MPFSTLTERDGDRSSPIIKRHLGEAVDLGSFGARYLLDPTGSQGRVSIIEHWVPARTLAAPLHRHSREDEYSFVVKGRMGAFINGKPIEAEAGDFVFKPRDDWHTFWNPGEEECRLLEIISPGGFEAMIKEIAENPDAMTGEAAAALDAKYGLEVDYSSIERLPRAWAHVSRVSVLSHISLQPHYSARLQCAPAAAHAFASVSENCRCAP